MSKAANIILLIALTALVGFAAGQDTAIQDTIRQRPSRIKDAPEKVDLDLNQDASRVKLARYLDQADYLIRVKNYQGALDILQVIGSEFPGDPGVTEKLAECYLKSGDFDNWLKNMRLLIEKTGPSCDSYSLMGEGFLEYGQLDSARIYMIEATKLSEGNEDIIKGLIRPLNRLGHFEICLDIIDTARAIFSNDSLMQCERGEALAGTGRFGEAAREYLAYIKSDSLGEEIGSDRLRSLLEFKGSADTVMAVLRGEINRYAKDNRLANVYGQLLIDRGQIDDAFTYYCQRDSLSGNSGSEIMHFISNCLNRKIYPAAIKGAQYYVDNFSDSPFAIPVRFDMIQALLAQGKFDEARSQLEYIRQNHTRAAHQAEADYQLGLLYKDHYDRPDSATEIFKDISRRFPNSIFDRRSRLELADVYIFAGALDSARTLFSELIDSANTPDEMVEKALYLEAMTYLFEQNFDEADKSFVRLINRFPRGLYVNDAIAKGVLMNDLREKALGQTDLFAKSEYFLYTERPDSAEYYLTRICKIKIPGLAPLAYFHLAELYRDNGQVRMSIEAADSLIVDFKDSYYRPFGMKLKADLLWDMQGRREEAVSLYKDILKDYSSYPFVSEIRKRLNEVDLNT